MICLPGAVTVVTVTAPVIWSIDSFVDPTTWPFDPYFSVVVSTLNVNCSAVRTTSTFFMDNGFARVCTFAGNLFTASSFKYGW